MKGLLKRAVVNGEVLEMIYLNSKGEISQRRIKVINLMMNRLVFIALLVCSNELLR